MHGSEPLDSLDFDDHSTFDHKVKAIPAVELDILVHYRERLLLLNFEAALSEFEDETRLVGRLQEPGANYSVHINGCAYDVGRSDEARPSRPLIHPKSLISAFSAISAVKNYG